MLSLLHIENIALIDRADISFGPGFNVLTGETGAGKSIIIDAIGAVHRGADQPGPHPHRGEKSALVTALFQQPPRSGPGSRKMVWDRTKTGSCSSQREIQGDGKNLCRVGGRARSPFSS